MFSSAIISFREFLEAFLIIGVFLGISRKLHLGREVEIIVAATTGFFISLLLASGVYAFGSVASGILTEERAEILSGYLMVFSGIFIAYVVFSLHNILRASRGGKLIAAHQKLMGNKFDLSLFFTIVMLVIREGFEIAIFTASTSLFSTFMQNFIGLVLGLTTASVLGLLTYLTYLKFSINKIFKITEYMIILLGAALVQNGTTEILEHTWSIHISDILQLPMSFLPSKETIVGHLLQSLTGIDNELSVVRIGVMGFYILGVYIILQKKLYVKILNKIRQ